MPLVTTLFSALAAFFLHHKGDIASKMVASGGYDMLKKSLDLGGLSSKIKRFFKKDDQADQFVKELCNQPLPGATTPEQAIRDVYKSVTGESQPDGLFAELGSWFQENGDALLQAVTATQQNTSGFNIGGQQAKGNIYNVQGDYNVNQEH